jgi:type IV pilus assembly protein PilA
MDPNSSRNHQLYCAAVGDQKVDYYVPKFERFDAGGSLLSWNWPAFFVTFLWLLYRRMYGLAVGYFFLLPFLFAVVLTVLVGTLGPNLGMIVYWPIALAAYFVVVPMFANAVYHWHVKRRLVSLANHAPSHDALVQRVIGQSSTGNVAVIVGGACIAGIFVLGILAAIAIPAYQDYVIRSQVVEGFTLSTPVKVAVAQSYESSGTWPTDLASAGLNEATYTGHYVSGVEVNDGVILIRYGNGANPKIAGHTVSLHPTLADGGNVEWSCGYAAGSATATDIPQKYLPRLCRAGETQVERL